MENMENLEIIISLAGTAISLFIASVTFIVKLIQGYIAKKKLKNNYVLLDAIAPLMEIAEEFTNYSGEEKKEYVMTKANQFAIENGIEFDQKAVSEKIEEMIKLSKTVNSDNTEEEL
jgi:hypothetical protein